MLLFPMNPCGAPLAIYAVMFYSICQFAKCGEMVSNASAWKYGKLSKQSHLLKKKKERERERERRKEDTFLSPTSPHHSRKEEKGKNWTLKYWAQLISLGLSFTFPQYQAAYPAVHSL
jgi:hypothetical protein